MRRKECLGLIGFTGSGLGCRVSLGCRVAGVGYLNPKPPSFDVEALECCAGVLDPRGLPPGCEWHVPKPGPPLRPSKGLGFRASRVYRAYRV